MKEKCAQEQIRTATSLRMPPPQSGASTNFATWALMNYKVLSQKIKVIFN